MGFGKNIKAARLRNGYSKEFVAVHLGITVSNLEKYESELRNPPLKKAGAIAELYGKSVSELMGVSIQAENIAAIRTDPLAQSSIDRVNRMRAAGMSEEKIDEFIDFAVFAQQKKQP